MRITDEQRAVFQDWLRRKVEHHSCPLCQSNRWLIADELFSNPAGDPLDEASAPTPVMAQVVCENCGHVHLFDVRRIADWHGEDASRSLYM
jgi:hypothetical protein